MKCNLPIFCGNVGKINVSNTTILIFEIVMILLVVGILIYLIKNKDKKTLRNLFITLIGVVLFEIMIDPMVMNTRFSSWTYYYHDLSFIVTLSWVFIVSISISLIDLVFSKMSDFKKFWLYLCTIDAITLPIEILLVQTGMRVYSQSLLSSSFGANIPFTNVPMEVAFAIPMFFALVIGFTKYWEKLLDAK